ncbi:MAG: heme-binding protein [Pseudomonadota bacterium]
MTRRSALLGMSATGLAASGAAAAEYRGYETPSWDVLQREGPFELRRYRPFLAAEVTIRGSADAALRQGFRTLAGYIFGKNTTAAKVAMTAPVTRAPEKIAMTAPVTRAAEGDAWTVRFMMPSEYTAETLPEPENQSIRIVELAPDLRSVVGFAGLATEARIANQERRLRRWNAAKGLEATGASEAAWFDDPFTLPWRRRNEVSLPVAMT